MIGLSRLGADILLPAPLACRFLLEYGLICV